MAFNASEQVSIRKYMCATKRFLDFTSAEYPLEDAMQVVGDDLDTAALITETLSKLTVVEEKMFGLHELAHITDAEEVTLNPSVGMRLLKNEGRRLIRIISDALGLEPLGDYFSAPKPRSHLEGWLF